MSSLWQSTDWEAFQKSLGHKTLRITVKDKKILGIINPLFLGYQYLYLPRIASLTSAEWEELTHRLRMLQKKEKLLFTRYDSTDEQGIPLGIKHKASHSPQPETTLVLDLKLSDEKLLAQMKRKGRYNIGLARKKGVTIKNGKNDLSASVEMEREKMVKRFYSLLQETTERDQFSGHKEKYYQNMIKNLKDSHILLATKNGVDLAGLIAVRSEDSMIYYYGASGNQHRELMAPYLLQWETIQLAKNQGLKQYDFLGIAPEGAAKDHPWKGITSFKKKFGGEILHFEKAKEIIHRPLLYRVFKLLKKIQKIIR
jgi:lipid II:glycine glycyltransferase (peptidoglycan interpeptide bridge formation enzyme)